MTEEERINDYQKSVNEEWRWLMAAHDLSRAADYLDKIHQDAIEKMDDESGTVPEGFGMDQQACYFKGKCIELYLKALYIRKGNSLLSEQGELNRLDGHKLFELSKRVGFEISPDEKKTLQKLADAVIFWGTYPVPLTAEYWRKNVEGITGVQPIYSWGQPDDSNFSKIKERLQNLLVGS